MRGIQLQTLQENEKPVSAKPQTRVGIPLVLAYYCESCEAVVNTEVCLWCDSAVHVVRLDSLIGPKEKIEESK